MQRRLVWGMSGYQWVVILAAWLGWGFDVFDSLLFNFVSGSCIPSLLHLTPGTPEAKSQTIFWTGIVTSLLLIGWGLGGIYFGRIADKLGRTRTLLFTMLLYSVGTAACAFAQDIWMLLVFRFIASLGIGGEWAAGAAMVAEVVPEERRVEAGALLYTAAPIGLFLATYVTYAFQKVFFLGNPDAWRYVFLCGLLPAVVALIVRFFVKEPERWKDAAELATTPKMSELFSPQMRSATLSGLCMAVVALLCWWCCNAFMPLLATQLAAKEAAGQSPEAISALQESWKAHISNMFNLGGLIGTLVTIPFAKKIGRKAMYGTYFSLAAIAIFLTFGLDIAPETRFNLAFFIGLTVFGIFGSFTYYLPELFPTRLRATGAGFCYNVGRFVTALGPFLVGMIAQGGVEKLLTALTSVSLVAVIGLLLLPMVKETRHQTLAD